MTLADWYVNGTRLLEYVKIPYNNAVKPLMMSSHDMET